MEAKSYDFGDTLGDGFEGMFDEGRGYKLEVVKLTDILVKKQIRGEMDGEDSSLDEMEESVKKDGILQTLLLRPIDGPIPYELIAGERRYRAAERAGEVHVPVLIREMTDQEAADIQLAENIHRKNLTQVEIAKKLKADLNGHKGDMDALMAQHKKSRTWLSKMLSLTSLAPQAARVISEGISADLEVIGMVKTVEKISPTAATAMVKELKETRGKVDARKVAEKHKDVVKPPAKAKTQKHGEKATVKDEAHKAPGTATVHNFAEAKSGVKASNPEWPSPGGDEGDTPEAPSFGTDPALPPSCIEDGYNLIFKKNLAPQAFMESLAKQERTDVEDWLRSFYDAGRNRDNMALGLIHGLRSGTFATEGAKAFAMLAFVQGGDAQVQKFNMLNILGLAKA